MQRAGSEALPGKSLRLGHQDGALPRSSILHLPTRLQTPWAESRNEPGLQRLCEGTVNCSSQTPLERVLNDGHFVKRLACSSLTEARRWQDQGGGSH